MIEIPDTFPRDPWPAAIPGAQPKFSARLIDCRFVVGLTDDERQERYALCQDLLDHLTAHVQHIQVQQPHVLTDAYLAQLEKAIRSRGWDLSPIEINWVFDCLKAQL